MEAAALGVVLLAVVLGVLSWRGERSRGRRRCPKCWYDMKGSGLVCPECGHDAKAVKNLYRARRRRLGLAAAVVLLIGAYGVWVVPRVRAGGPVAAVPTWVLIAGLRWWPDWMTIEDSGKYDDDWTLYGRVVQQRTWQVERWWLRKRARGIVASGPGVWGLARAAEFLDGDGEDKDLAPAMHVAVVRGLVDMDQAVRNKACEAVFPTGDSVPRAALRPYLPVLLERLDDSSLAVREMAVFYITHSGDDAGGAVPRIIECIRTHSPMSAFGFVMGLERLCGESAVAVHQVIDASRDENPVVRRACAIALGAEKAIRVGAADRLLEMLDDADEWTARAAARSLCQSAADAGVVVPRLLEWAEGGTTGCYRIPTHLHKFGRALQPYVHRLGKFLDAPETRTDAMYVITWAVYRKEGLDCSPLLDRIVALARSEDPEAASIGGGMLEALANRYRRGGVDE
jgi:hypothetical protein